LAKPVADTIQITLGALASVSLTQIMISSARRALRPNFYRRNNPLPGARTPGDPDQAIWVLGVKAGDSLKYDPFG
jgi:hypothetical protein